LLDLILGMGNLPNEFKNSFDLALSTGSFIEGHLPTATFDEMIETIKIGGGYMIFSIRESLMEKLGHKAKLEELERDGKISKIK